MLNVIKMELYRLFRSKSLYITAGVCAGVIALLILLTAALMSALTEMVSPSDMTVSAGDAAAGIAVSAGGGEAAADPSLNPVSFCGSFISGFCKIMVAIFIAIFIHGFYKDGYDKNVIACVKNRWYFQAAKAACVAVYTAFLLVVSSVTALVTSALTVDGFTFGYMGVFWEFLLGEFLLLNAIGLLSAFLTELTRSKVTSIVYILLASTSLISGLLSLLESRLSSLFHREIELWKLLPSLYQSSFELDAPDTSGNGGMMLHAVVLSLVFMVIYNAAGAFLITKRDVK